MAQENTLTRHQVRELAFRALFALNAQPDQNKMELKSALFENNQYDDYYDVLVNGVSNMFGDLDGRYEKLLPEKWNLSRVSNVSKTIIRIAIYEHDERIDIPTKVAFDEAVHMITDYGDEGEKSFINGLLGQYEEK